MKKNKIEIVSSIIIISILVIMAIYSFGSKVLNKFYNNNDSSVKSVTINFAKQYPFENKKVENQKSLIEKYESKINTIKEKIENVTSKDLIGYEKMIELSYAYNDLIKFNLVSNNSSDARIELDDDNYSRIVSKQDVSTCVNKIDSLKNFLDSQKIDFLYVQAPYKIPENYQLPLIYKDYTNENMNEFLNKINGKVDYIDLRENLISDNLDHLKLFFKTDHHWLPETGLWATNVISNYINEKYNLSLKTDNILKDKFNYETYPNMYLGSDGRYVSLKNAKPDDFTMITPNYETDFEISIPNLNLNKKGSYSDTLIDWSKLKYGNYYKISQYTSYLYGDKPLIEIKNNLVNNDKKILVIRDSFSEVVLPFLALENEYVSAIDLRQFNGSLYSYIKDYQPNLVLILYNGKAIIDLKNDEEIAKLWNIDN